MQLTGRSILLKSSKDEYKSIEDFQRRHGASVVLYLTIYLPNRFCVEYVDTRPLRT